MRLIADLRFTLRQFRKAPVFTITILAVLALGVGATTAIFGLFDQVLLRTLPVSHPEELVRLQAHTKASAAASVPVAETWTNTPRSLPIAMYGTTPEPFSAA